MANRPTGGTGNSRFDKKQNFQQNQFGLPEAYTVLKSDFLELKKAYLGNEQQLVEMQEQYFTLQQSYQKLQQDSQAQQAKLLENLEKGYQAYNEKFMKVEELEDKLNKCNKELKEIKEQNENQVQVAMHLQDESSNARYQKQAFEEAVKKSLANVGLSLGFENDNYQINILDYEKLGQLSQKSNNHTKGEKVIKLEHDNAFLRQSLLSLQEYSQKQQEKLTRATDLLQKKTGEYWNLNKGIQGKGNNGTFVVKTRELAKIAMGLSEMSDFILELKKTISDQNSWIDMLVEALSENKKSNLSEGDKINTENVSLSLPKSKPSVSGVANHSDLSGGPNQRKKNKPKKKRKPTGQKPCDKPTDICPEAASGNNNISHTKAKKPTSVLQVSNKVEDEKLGEFQGYIVVPSRKNSAFHDREVAKPHVDAVFPFLSLQTKTRAPMNEEPKSLQNELYHMSSLSVQDRMETGEQFATDSTGQFPQGLINYKPKQKQAASTDNTCPICNLIFDEKSDLKKLQIHINSHFKD